jgi:siroheme synthase
MRDRRLSILSCYCQQLTVVVISIIQVFAELKDLADKITTVELVSPTLMIIGNVVALSPLWSPSMKEASFLVQAK